MRAFLKSPEFKAHAKRQRTDDAQEWDRRLKRAQALNMEHKLAVEKGAAWPSELVRRLYAAGDAALIATLRKSLESDLPPLIAGKSAAEVLSINIGFLDRLTVQLIEARDAAVAESA